MPLPPSLPAISRLSFGFIRRLLLGCLVFCLLGAAHGTTDESLREMAPDIRRIIERGELVVAMPKFDSPPFFFQRDGQVQGIDAKLAEDLARQLQVKVRFHRTAGSFNEVVSVVARGEADVAICKLSLTLTRAKFIRFSNPYVTLRHALAVNRVRIAEIARERDLPTVIRNFSGSIGVMANTSYVDYARQNFPAAKIVEFPNWEHLLQALKNGEIDSAYRDEFEIKRITRQDPRNSLILRTVTLSDTQDSLAMAVRHDAGQLRALLNIFLARRPTVLGIDEILNLAETPP